MVASFGLIGGICLVFDFLDARIRCRQDLGAVIGGPGAEPVTALNGVEPSPDFAGILAINPAHSASAAVRELALRLTLEQQPGAGLVVSFVPLNSGVGTSTLALNVGSALMAHGTRVLVLGLAGDPTVLMKNMPGFRPDSLDAAASAPGGLRAGLHEMLQSGRRSYDFVLIDGPPVLDSDIAHKAAVEADVVLLVAREDESLYPQARRTVEWLIAAGVPAIGAVLNFSHPHLFEERIVNLVGFIRRTITFWHKSATGKTLSVFSKKHQRTKGEQSKA